MATSVVTLVSTCAGGCHAVINYTLDGAASRQMRIDKDEIRKPLTLQEVDEAMLTILRVKARDATRNQITNALQAGFTITI